MVELITMRIGPLMKGVRLRRLAEPNHATAPRIADRAGANQNASGATPVQEPQTAGLAARAGGGSGTAATASDHTIRVCGDGRVLATAKNFGRRMHHVGDLRLRKGLETFVLATKANGFFAPVDDGIARALRDLDGLRLRPGYGEGELAADIAARLRTVRGANAS